MKENTNKRTKINPKFNTKAINECKRELRFRLIEKGAGTFSSRHEIQGVLTEEYHEAIDALRGNNIDEFKQELIDIAVSCIFGIACIEAKTLEW